MVICMKRPELLAPVGNFDSLVAAIEAGCDAVYLSGKLYGARSYAGNFSNDELIKSINYAHQYGVKVYITINTLIYEDEIDNFIKYVEFLYINNADAVIIQDIGMFDLIRQLYPNLEIHISTQMHIHNLEGAQLVEQLGASRVVLARESSYELVKEIKEKCNIELELFVHGALCISYSGQCLMSSLIGGRSGNRGTCAQCCRQPYDLYEDGKRINHNKYLLSTRDLNSLENIGKLIDIGIDSFKIEGRMKRPEYVYLVVSLYRKAIDNYLIGKTTKITEKDIDELRKIFNRQFTNGFLFHTKNNEFINKFRPNHMGIEIGKVVSVTKNRVNIKLCDTLNLQDGIRFIGEKDFGMNVQIMYKNGQKINSGHKSDIVSLFVKEIPAINSLVIKTTDYKQLTRINNEIKAHPRKVSLTVKISAKLNKNLKIILVDDNNYKIEMESSYIVSKGLNCATKKSNIIQQLKKMGNTIYTIVSLEIDMDENIFIPVKTLNELRREACLLLTNKRLQGRKLIKGEYCINVPNFSCEQNKVLLNTNVDQVQKLLSDYDELIIPINKNVVTNDKVRYKLPRVLEYLGDTKDNILVGELGSVFKYCDGKHNVATDFSLNVTNSYSVALLHSLGVYKVTLSLELNDYQIKKIIDNYYERYHKHPNLELITRGIPEVMVLKYDLFEGHYNSNHKYYLKDKYNNKFPVVRRDNLTYIYYCSTLDKQANNRYYELGINNLRENSIKK